MSKDIVDIHVCERCGAKPRGVLTFETVREENESVSPELVGVWLCDNCHSDYLIEVAGDELDCL